MYLIIDNEKLKNIKNFLNASDFLIAKDEKEYNEILESYEIQVVIASHTNSDIVLNSKFDIPFVIVITENILDTNVLTNIKEIQKKDCSYIIMLSDIYKIQSILHNFFKKCIDKNNILIKLPLFSKSIAMSKTIKTAKKLNNCHCIGIFGAPFSGKKFFTEHLLQSWHKHSISINFTSEEETFQQNLNTIKHIIQNKIEKIIILNATNKVTEENQNILSNLIHSTIGMHNIKWILLSSTEDIISEELFKMFNNFKIIIPNFEERTEDINELYDHLNNNYYEIQPKNFDNWKDFAEYIFEKFTKNSMNFEIDKKFFHYNLKDATNIFQKIYLTNQINNKIKLKDLAKSLNIDRTTLYRKLHNIKS